MGAKNPEVSAPNGLSTSRLVGGRVPRTAIFLVPRGSRISIVSGTVALASKNGRWQGWSNMCEVRACRACYSSRAIRSSLVDTLSSCNNRVLLHRCALRVHASGVAVTLVLHDVLKLSELVALGALSKRVPDSALLQRCHERLHGTSCKIESCCARAKISRDFLRPFSLLRKRKIMAVAAASQGDLLVRFDFIGEQVTAGPLPFEAVRVRLQPLDAFEIVADGTMPPAIAGSTSYDLAAPSFTSAAPSFTSASVVRSQLRGVTPVYSKVRVQLSGAELSDEEWSLHELTQSGYVASEVSTSSPEGSPSMQRLINAVPFVVTTSAMSEVVHIRLRGLTTYSPVTCRVEGQQRSRDGSVLSHDPSPVSLRLEMFDGSVCVTLRVCGREAIDFSGVQLPSRPRRASALSAEFFDRMTCKKRDELRTPLAKLCMMMCVV
jgi:hypothetical protein